MRKRLNLLFQSSLLALVLGVLPLVVGFKRRVGKLLEVDGTDDHAGLEPQRHLPRVVELKDNVSGPPRINPVGCRVDHEPEPRERRPPVQPADDVRRESHALARGPKRELPGLQHKELPGTRPDGVAHDLIDDIADFLAAS